MGMVRGTKGDSAAMSGGPPDTGKPVTRPLRAYISNLSCERYIVNFHPQPKTPFLNTSESENTN